MIQTWTQSGDFVWGGGWNGWREVNIRGWDDVVDCDSEDSGVDDVAVRIYVR